MLPPKVTNHEQALKYLAGRKTRKGESQFVSLRKSILPLLSGGPSLLIFSVTVTPQITQRNFWVGLVLGGSIFAFGAIQLLTAQRLVGLLALFDEGCADNPFPEKDAKQDSPAHP